MSDSKKRLLTGQSDEARQIADALGLSGFFLKSLQLTIDPEHPIRVDCVIYPTAEQVEALGGELEKFKGFGTVTADVAFNYEYKQ